MKNFTRHRIKLSLSIPKIFFFSKSDLLNISKSCFKRLYTLVIVFQSSSFFGRIRFLIRSPTKNPLTFGRTCDVSFSLPPTALWSMPSSKSASKKSSFLKKSCKNPPSYERSSLLTRLYRYHTVTTP